MNYEQKQAARKTRYIARAKKAQETSADYYETFKQQMDALPMGQPILVGHHSEKRHRALLRRADNAMRHSIKEQEKAAYYEHKASSVGTGGISSDDERAIEKLTDKIAALEAAHRYAKAGNKIYRTLYRKAFKQCQDSKAAFYEAADAFAQTDKEAADELLKQTHYYASVPYEHLQPFMLNRTEIRRLQDRLKIITAIKTQGDKTITHETFTFKQDSDGNRLCFIFKGKPDEATRTLLKRHAFKWSPTRTAWIRKTTPNAIGAAKVVIEQLKAGG
jgi:aminopeptidase N